MVCILDLLRLVDPNNSSNSNRKEAHLDKGRDKGI